MAIGVPKKARTADGTGQAPEAELTYRGKRSTTDILSAPPEADAYAPLWDGGENRLYFGDNASVLRCLLRDKSVAGQVRLIYIDPPFATRSRFHCRKQEHAYEDTLAGADYLEHLRERLVLLRELLAADGSIYLHLDDKMVFHAKVLMDEIFGATRFRSCIIRKKCNPKNYTRKTFGNVADFILFYTVSDDFVFNRPMEPWTEARAKEYQYVEPDTGRRFMKVPVHAPGVRNGASGQPWRGKLPPPGKHWQYTPETLDAMDARGEIFWSANGNPRRKVYLDQSAGVSVQNIWTDFRDAHNQNISITGYPTEKNPELLARIIEASSNPGDLVLDCFAGSGTTLAAADRLSRRWIGADSSFSAIRTMLRRFANGTERMGDFVGACKPPSKSMTLFPELGSVDGVRDFKLLAQSSVAPELRTLVDAFANHRRGQQLGEDSIVQRRMASS